jgi:glycosyltransferase involved in cell wall biosynthesis
LRQNKSEHEGIYVLFVGRYSEEKGFDRMAEIALTFPEVHFIMVGNKEALFENISNIEERGLLNASELTAVYALADILIVPSRDDAFPSVVREYSWFGKPILATDVGGMIDFEELGLDIEIVENRIEALKDGLQKLLAREKLVNQNQNVYDLYFNPNSENVVERYCEILGGRI